MKANWPGNLYIQLFIKTFRFIPVLFVLFACNNNKPVPVELKTPAANITIDTTIFYPVQEFFEMQLAKGAFIRDIQYKSLIDGKETANIFIDTARFRQLAQPFLIDDINNPAIKKFYRESVFHDASTVSNTFTYTSTEATLPLQTLNILLDTATDQVKHVFITKNYVHGDTVITEKLNWKTGENFSINKIIRPPHHKETVAQTMVSWKPK